MPSTSASAPIRPLPVRGIFRVGRAVDIWYKSAISSVVVLSAITVPLLALGRLDLALFAVSGGLAAMYGHGLPYPARARTVLGVAVGMVLAAGVALTASALTESAAIRIAVIAAIAALQKALCDAARVGPPGNIVMTFLSSGLAFVPERLGDIPFHLALAAMGAAFAWLVCMAPALLRPHGPERIATARALESAARLGAAGPGGRHETGTLLMAGWQTLARMPKRGARAGATRRALEQLLLRAESALHGAGEVTADQLRDWARDLRSNRPLPRLSGAAVPAGQLPPHPAPEPPGPVAMVRALRPGSPLLPVVARVAVGCAAGGWIALLLGVGHPYWGVITASSVFTGNAAQGWSRAVNRVLGSLIGLAAFTALQPVLTLGGKPALVAVALVCMACAEATMARSYWLGISFVTPLALVMNEFGAVMPAHQLVAQRWIDTCVGAAVGLLCCLLVPNRLATRRIHFGLRGLAAAEETARRALAAGGSARPGPSAERRTAAHHALGHARHALSGALIELRAAAESAAGEWWQPAAPREDVESAVARAQGLLGELARRREVLAFAEPVAVAVRVRVPEPAGRPVSVEVPISVPGPGRA